MAGDMATSAGIYQREIITDVLIFEAKNGKEKKKKHIAPSKTEESTVPELIHNKKKLYYCTLLALKFHKTSLSTGYNLRKRSRTRSLRLLVFLGTKVDRCIR